MPVVGVRETPDEAWSRFGERVDALNRVEELHVGVVEWGLEETADVELREVHVRSTPDHAQLRAQAEQQGEAGGQHDGGFKPDAATSKTDTHWGISFGGKTK